ncbi:sigma 54-interacting transcriptional regulator [Oceanobacillus halotolerans]|uniref:sigma 54-interacting transcriptional regulator n=1 Tax=Oceanobacillus halotolerans TaxID=2663380 RepID=UPI0013DA51E6|nr:sigma 54-interacting transcriptional regulator [Oceanobacillus halotolerans]
MEKPELLVLAYQSRSLNAIVEHLEDVGFSKHCKISGTLVKDLEFNSVINPPTLMLATSEIVYKMSENFINPNTPYIIAKRSINFAKIKELLSLPRFSRIYLVNNMKEAAEETINTLLEVGISHDYIPYYGQIEPDSSITIAVTPGEVEMIPDTISTKINIGHRLLDMTTLFEIYKFFGISTFGSNNQLTARYIHSSITLIKELHQEILQSKGLHKSLEGIVDRIEEGLVVYDQSNRIISINSQSLKLLNKEYNQLINNDIRTLPVLFYNAFMQVEMEKENFIDIDNIPYYIRKKRIFVGTKVFATIILFEKVDRIKRIETKYRRSTRDKVFKAKHHFSDIKTNSPNMISLIDKAKKMAYSDSTILISGETGTGKEVMAQAIHSASNRKNEPFVAVNLAAIPETLVESELFGYEKGAFTGANQTGSTGLFERAHKGTVFLDEIGDASPIIQNRLLRVLQEKEIQRVGGAYPIPIDVRVITATNKNLRLLIEENKFRKDLYYRLSILPISIIPLRKRKEDILLLIELFSKEFEEKLQCNPITFLDSALDYMFNYHWPGNVRELRNTVEYLAHVQEGDVLPEDLPFYDKEQRDLLNEKENNEEMIIRDLRERGFLDESITILTTLSKINGSIGRKKLLTLIIDRNQNLTEQKLRYRLETLSKMNLIDVKQGRKGTSINDEGMRFINYIKQKKHNT